MKNDRYIDNLYPDDKNEIESDAYQFNATSLPPNFLELQKTANWGTLHATVYVVHGNQI